MDAGSPISLNLSFPVIEGTSGNNNPKVETSSKLRNFSSTTIQSATQGDQIELGNNVTRSHHRPSIGSIDSVFERDLGGQWSPHHPESQPRSNSNASLVRDNDDGLDENGHGKLPAWSELKTKAGKERKRLPLACIACRRKKIRCSGEKPACKHCLKARIPCVYKVTTRKAAPRTDYMAMLDKRLKRMEDRVIKIIPKEDLPDLSVTGRSSVRPPLPGQTPKKDKSSANHKRSAEEAFDSEMKNWTESRQAVSILTSTAKSQNPRDSENKLLTEGTDALPPTNIQEHLAEVFFDCIYGQSYLLLHKPSFMRKLKAGTVPPVLTLAVCAVSARFSTHPQVSSEPAFLRGEQWATPAKSIVEKRHFEPNITVLTVMLILGLHYFGTCEGGLSWSFGGQAMRMGYALQLHRELDHDPLGRAQAERAAATGKSVPKIPELSFTDREIRRRTMWACYLMDTFNSSGTERPSFLSEEYMSIQLPIKESHFQMEIPGHTQDINSHVPLSQSSSVTDDALEDVKSNMGVAAYIVRGVVIWKRIVKYLNLGGKEKDSYPIWDPLSQFAVLQRQIAQLNSSLPTTLTYTAENLATHVAERLANQFLFLHIVLAQNGLFLHRFAIPTAPNTHRPYPPNTPRTFLSNSASAVIEAASTISKILADSTGHTLTVPFAGYCAYAASTVHVWGIFSRNAKLEASSRENLRHNYKYLNRMKRYWGMFHYMAESIKDIYRAFADASAVTRQLPKVPENTSLNVVDGTTISNFASRAPSPTSDEPQLSSANTSKTSSADSATTKESRSSASGRLMFQYGDWFDKYPHGVSEKEWETTHLPHRSETQKGTEAVMSQQSDLQSVEEFFASLSPPSKADNDLGSSGNRGKKFAKKRGKSVVEEKNPAKVKESAVTTVSQEHPPQLDHGQTSQGGHQRSSSQAQSLPPRHTQSLPGILPTGSTKLQLETSDIDHPMSGIPTQLQSRQNSAFDLSSPTGLFHSPQHGPTHHLGSLSGPTSMPTQKQSPFDYRSPSTTSNAGSGVLPQTQSAMNFNFNYTSALPHLDRQMVFGGYAGIDPSTSNNASALNHPNNLNFWSNPWETIDMDGFGGFSDPFGATGTTGDTDGLDGGAGPGVGASMNNLPTTGMGSTGPGMGTNYNPSAGVNSSAWFMPFNIDPPTYGMSMDDYMGFDAMDMSSTGGGGSFSGPSAGPNDGGLGGNGPH